MSKLRSPTWSQVSGVTARPPRPATVIRGCPGATTTSSWFVSNVVWPWR